MKALFYFFIIIEIVAAQTKSLKTMTEKPAVLSKNEFKDLKKGISACLSKKTIKCAEKYFEVPFEIDWTKYGDSYPASKKCKPSDYKTARKIQEIIDCLEFDGVSELFESCMENNAEIISEGSGVLAVYGEIATCRFRNKSNGWKMYEINTRP